jgi:hypothetical protein
MASILFIPDSNQLENICSGVFDLGCNRVDNRKLSIGQSRDDESGEEPEIGIVNSKKKLCSKTNYVKH